MVLLEKKVALPIEKAYMQLKDILLQKKCKIIEDKPPEYLLVKQGSLFGTSPKSAKKIVNFQLSSEGNITKITGSTEITPDWKNITLYGTILAAFLVGIFMWIAIDLQNYLQTAKPNNWSWILPTNSYIDPSSTTHLIQITIALAIFLIITIAAEILIAFYVYSRKKQFAQECLNAIN